jgi:hypothetical protein
MRKTGVPDTSDPARARAELASAESSAVCPRCGVAGNSRTECAHCGVIFAKYRARAQPSAEAAAAPAPLPLPIITQPVVPFGGEAKAFGDAAGWKRTEVIALPAAFAFAAFLNFVPITRFLLQSSLVMELHEFGHAVVLWLAGRFAVPLPMVTISVSEGRSAIVFIFFACAFTYLFFLARSEECRGLMVLAAALLATQIGCTAFMDLRTLRMVCAFGGVAGESWLAALFVVGFYHRLPHRARWGNLRHGFLVIGAASLVFNTERWLAARTNPGRIPWGAFFGGHGDMDLLRDAYHWTPQDITTAYLRLLAICYLTVIAYYSWHLWQGTTRAQAGE